MLNIEFNFSKSNIPVLSKTDIEEIAEEIIADFNPGALISAQPIDEDRLITEYLGLEQDFQYLSHCGFILGLIVFEDTNKIEVYDEEMNRAKYISVKAGTIIIDSTLTDESQTQKRRYKFTATHEAAHWILHRHKYFTEELSLVDDEFKARIRCRKNGIEQFSRKNKREWNDEDWMEWQANYLAGALLMPKSMVFSICDDEYLKNLKGITNNNLSEAITLIIKDISDTFDVSKEAAKIRLLHLGILIKKK